MPLRDQTSSGARTASLTEHSAISLADAIRQRKVTAEQVMEAHIEVLERDRQRLNAVVADNFAAARARAHEIDQRIGGTALRGRPQAELPPLTGVPFTVKESVALKGMPHTAGVPARRGHLATRSATVVQRLVNAGAIPVAVTNVAEAGLWIESDNPLYGRTVNPYDPARTPGGSSGGEAAVVGSGGSPFGVAADIGGSIRVPALFCGVFGHKPTPGLLPSTGHWPPPTDAAAQLLSLGVLARRAEDLMPLIKTMAGPDGLDQRVAAIELGEPAEVSLDGLTVTLVEDSALRPVARELRDARERAAGALAAAGARVRVTSLPSWRRALLPFLMVLRGGDAGGPRVSSLLADADGRLGRIGQLVGGGDDHTLPTRLTLFAELIPISAGERRRLVGLAQELARELVETIGDGVLLHPAHRTPAPRLGRTYGRPWLLTPAAVFNLAGVPVTEVPLGVSRAGLPVGVQVAAAPGADHLSIAVALELEAVFGGWVPPGHGRGSRQL
jgi:fatty acid amide hydrolase 2